MSTDTMIEMNEVHKWFGDLHVLNDVNLKVNRGEKIVICGPSGSGKSTLIRCINRLEEHQRGQIIVEGTELTNDNRSVEKIRGEVGMVFQQFNLWSHMTVLQNVVEAPVSVLGLAREKAEDNAHAYLNKVGIGEKWNAFPSELSGGQQQRAAIARALCMEPSALLFDEPTSALDPELEQEVIKVIKDLALEGRTMIIVTHDMRLAADVSNHVVFLHKGLIEEEGSPNSLFKSPKSERLQKFLSSTRAA